MSALRTAARLAGGLAGAGVGTLLYARYVETARFCLRRYDVACLPAGSSPLTLLHLSDLHLLPDQNTKREFVRSLAALEPDLVIDTGDNIASADAIGALAGDLVPLLRRPGAFVFGSNDKYEPVRKNPARYLRRDPRTGSAPLEQRELPLSDLADVLTSGGWLDLTNRRDALTVGDLHIEFVGVDDPHLEHDAFPAADRTATGPRPQDEATVRLGVAHAPYQRVLDSFVQDGADLILAGHTHGGQICLPGGHALVTNCDLPRSQASGLSAWQGVPLHVSAGLGASPYQQWRLFCPPEASLITLHARG